MRGWLFGVFLIALLVSIILTAVGLLANWGIWITTPLVKQGEKLPLLENLVTGVLLAIVALLLELGRRWFIARNAKDQLADAYVRLVAAAVILPTTTKEESDTNYTYITDYIDQNLELENEELKSVVSTGVKSAMLEMMRIRYGGAAKPQRQIEVLPVDGASAA
jgi:hypothetical protein